MAIFALLTVAAHADTLSAPPGLQMVFAPETTSALLFALLLGLGIVGQMAGRYYASRSASLIGAALVICAGLFDYDPVLVVGQLVIMAALWPNARQKARRQESLIPRSSATSQRRNQR